MFALKIFRGPCPHLGCALANLGESLARIKIWRPAPPKGRNLASRKSPLGWVNMRAYDFFVSGPKFTNCLLHHRGWNVVDQILFRFSLCVSFPEIFAIKVESCQKSCRILDVFCHPKFSSLHPFQNLCPRCHPGLEPYPLVCEVTACIHRYAKVIGAHIWNLSPIFMFTLKILGDHRPRLWCALASLGQTLDLRV